MVLKSNATFAGAYLMVGFFSLMGFSKAANHWEEQEALTAYMEWELQVALDLDALQLRRVKEINREFCKQVFSVYENRLKNEPPLDELNRLILKRHDQVLEILTDKQRHKWQNMMLRRQSKKE